MDAIAGMLRWASSTTSTPIMLVRVLPGLILVAAGLTHVFNPDDPMRPLVEAMGLPFPVLLAPLATASEITAGLSLLLGAWARLGSLLGISVMAVALYSHYAIEVWPNPQPAPPDAVPIVVITLCLLVLSKGAGRWSIDLLRAPTP